jgi:hypothetical protein
MHELFFHVLPVTKLRLSPISIKYVTCDVVVIVVDDEMTQNAFYIFFVFS